MSLFFFLKFDNQTLASSLIKLVLDYFLSYLTKLNLERVLDQDLRKLKLFSNLVFGK